MTLSINLPMPENKDKHSSVAPRGNDAGYFITLPSPVGDDDHLHLAVNISDRTILLNHDPALFLEPGDLVITGARQAGLLAGDGGALAFFRIPFSLLDASAADLREVPQTHLSGGSGLASLVSQFLTALARTPGSERLAAGQRLAMNAADLVALLVGEVLQARGPGSADAISDLMLRIQSHIEENLTDPDLSPESIARAHHISVRYLHKVFQSGGTTVGAWIRQRRLDACRAELRRQRRTVASVAHSWGFASPSHFSRLFRQTYGLTPREWQTAASSDA
ncbi:helix-turn-helix transcriptional regulator [Streptomyces sp. NRRL S-340]|uniref:helix-turn-helix transcriptional regulator n=1 Tax=Streptomyces sp. NRRL S-340 TaxID=1463901 RepID=UPI00055DDC97|nr:helix-turn-helix transcriptional regulator [Streptomyces sp. NRRL S-340]